MDPYVRNGIAAQNSPPLHVALWAVKSALTQVDLSLGLVVDQASFESARSALIAALNNGVSAATAVTNPFQS